MPTAQPVLRTDRALLRRAGGVWFGLALALLWWACPGDASAAARAAPGAAGNAAVEAVDATPAHVDLVGHARLLHDSDGTARPATILQRLEQFQTAQYADLARGYRSGVYWMHIELINPSADTLTRWLVIDGPLIETATLHSDGHVPQHTGMLMPRAERVLPTGVPAFKLELRPGERRRLLLRFKGYLPMVLVPSLWEPLAWQQHAGTQHVLQAMALGAVLLASVLSLLVFAIYRDVPYLHFAVFLIAGGLLQAGRNGLLLTHLWPGTQPLPNLYFAVSGGATLVSLALFVAHFLGLPQRRCWPPHCLALIGLLAAALLPHLLMHGSGARAAALGTFLLLFYLLVVTGHVWRQGYPPARFLIAALGLALVAEMWRQLSILGWLPWVTMLNLGFSQWLLAASPLILVALSERTRKLTLELEASRQISGAKSAFLARVSHELRSPLNLIIGYARMLKRASARLEPIEGARAIEQSSLHMLALVEELLDQARLAAGRLVLHPQAVHLAPLLDEIARDAAVLAHTAGNTVALDWSGDAGQIVHLDGQRLRQVLDNLLANANRNTHGGQIVLRCEARQPTGDTAANALVTLYFAVSDTGRGIALPDQARIMQPFVQIDDGQSGGGVGLGLSIARELLELMGSTLSLRSAPGQGSTFSFALRCMPAAAPDGKVHAERLQDTAADPTRSAAVTVPTVSASSSTPAPPSMPAGPVRAGQEPAALTPPEPAALRALQTLIEQGAVSDIEDWVSQWQDPGAPHAAFAAAVSADLRRLDLAGLRQRVAHALGATAPA